MGACLHEDEENPGATMTDLTSLRFALVTLVLGLSACAAELDDQPLGPDAGQVVRPDAAPEQQSVPPDAPVDAAPVVPPVDACAPQVTQLLVNPAFDMSPRGTGWQERLAAPDYPLITSVDGVPEHTPVAKVWLGGLEAPTTTISDVAFQDIVIPPQTTHLVVTGFHDVRTAEAPTTVAYDQAKIVMTDPSGVLIADVLSLSNVTPTTTWTAFGYAFTQDLSGRTVRIHLTSINDDIDATSFFFDSLAITATHGCATIQ
jgi:hypothetical protein